MAYNLLYNASRIGGSMSPIQFTEEQQQDRPFQSHLVSSCGQLGEVVVPDLLECFCFKKIFLFYSSFRKL